MKTAPRSYSWLLVFITIISVGFALFWSAQRDYENFKTYQREIMRESVTGTSKQIAYLIESYQTALRIFVDRQGPALHKLLANPTDEDIHKLLSENLAKYYSDHFSLTIADRHGDLIYDDLGEKVGEVCRKDIKLFANNTHQSLTSIVPFLRDGNRIFRIHCLRRCLALS